jgi:hypothetical protein
MCKFAAVNNNSYQNEEERIRSMVVALLKIVTVVSNVAVWIHLRYQKACRSYDRPFFMVMTCRMK